MWDQGTAPVDRGKPTKEIHTHAYTHTQKHTRAEHMPQLMQEMKQDSVSCRWPNWKQACQNNNSLAVITQQLYESLSNPLSMLHFELCIILGFFLIKALCFLKENPWLNTKFKHTSIFTFKHQTLSQQRKGLQLLWQCLVFINPLFLHF